MSMIHQGVATYLYSNPLYVGWDPTIHCNFHCSYCGQARPKSPDWCSLPDTLKMFDRLLEMGRDGYYFGLSGGEPTINPHLPYAIKHISDTFEDKVENIQMFSNGSAKIDLYESLASIKSKYPLALYISVHSDHITDRRITDLVSNLAFHTTLRMDVMFNPLKRERVHDIFDLLLSLREKYPFRAPIVTVLDRAHCGPHQAYISEDFLWRKEAVKKFEEVARLSGMKSEANCFPFSPNITASYSSTYNYNYVPDYDTALKDGTLSLKGKYCILGSHIINIKPSGIYQGAICPVAKLSKKPLYEINPYDDPDFCKPVICTTEKCSCMANYMLQKYSSKIEAEHFHKYHMLRQRRAEATAKKEVLLKQTVKEQSLKLDSLTKMTRNQNLLLKHFCESEFPYRDFIDQDYYFAQYPDVAQSGFSAAEHWKTYGWRENRNPAPWFDTKFYLSQFSEADRPKSDPLVHYILEGCSQDKLPSARTSIE